MIGSNTRRAIIPSACALNPFDYLQPCYYDASLCVNPNNDVKGCLTAEQYANRIISRSGDDGPRYRQLHVLPPRDANWIKRSASTTTGAATASDVNVRDIATGTSSEVVVDGWCALTWEPQLERDSAYGCVIDDTILVRDDGIPICFLLLSRSV
jgi:hypothetical protein